MMRTLMTMSVNSMTGTRMTRRFFFWFFVTRRPLMMMNVNCMTGTRIVWLVPELCDWYQKSYNSMRMRNVCMYVCMYVYTYVWMYVCMYIRMYVCMYVYTYVCMYECMYYIRIYIHTYIMRMRYVGRRPGERDCRIYYSTHIYIYIYIYIYILYESWVIYIYISI